jgi:hypothetical protein
VSDGKPRMYPASVRMLCAFQASRILRPNFARLVAKLLFLLGVG